MEPVNETAVSEAAVNETAVQAGAEPVKEKKGIPGSTLKIVAIVTMLIDHIGAVVLESILSTVPTDAEYYLTADPVYTRRIGLVSVFDVLFRCIGRLAFPLFIFLLVQGFIHTHNRAKYAFRLFLFALISEIPFNLARTGYILSKPFSGVTFEYQSVFWTLLAGFLFMCYAEFIKTKDLPRIAGIGMTVASLALAGVFGYRGAYFEEFAAKLLHVDVKTGVIIKIGIFVLTMAVVFVIWLAKKGLDDMLKFASVMAGLLFFMALAGFGNTDYDMWGVLAIGACYAFINRPKGCIIAPVAVLSVMSIVEAFAFFDILLIKKYNGERGLKIKYFFYAFYPVHLLLLYMISWLLGYQPGRLFLGY